MTISDDFVKSLELPISVIPAKPVPACFKQGAGIQSFQRFINTLDSGFHRSDNFLRDHQY